MSKVFGGCLKHEDTGTVDRRLGNGRPQTACTAENVILLVNFQGIQELVGHRLVNHS